MSRDSGSGNAPARASWTALALLATSLATNPAGASTTTVDFEDAKGFVVISNYIRDGYRFSPNCHRDHPLGPTGIWLGWDSAGCGINPPPFPQIYNENFLGPEGLKPTGPSFAPAYIYLDNSGDPFSLLSLDIIAGSEMTFTSSKGGMVMGSTGLPHLTVVFFGDAWTDIRWVLMGPVTGGAPNGVDNVVLQEGFTVIPEPSTLALGAAALALGLLPALRRRHRA